MSKTSSEMVTFVNSESDARVANRLYADAALTRIPLWNVDKLRTGLGLVKRFWVDACLDGYPEFDETSNWAEFMRGFPWHAKLIDSSFIAKPQARDVEKIVGDLLDRMLVSKPSAVSVPQLAFTSSTAHNAINRCLAKVFGNAIRKRKFDGLVILPAIFTHQDQLLLKGERDKKLKFIGTAIAESGATVVWAVDTSLADQAGTQTFENKRFPALISLHKEISRVPGVQKQIAGPYWGINLVLWCKGEVSHPACSLGTGYQYYRSGQTVRSPTPRVAIAPLRRWARASSDFWGWCADTVERMADEDPAKRHFVDLLGQRKALELDSKAHKEQVAAFYRTWLKNLEAVPAPGRAIALYQDLSSGHVLGCSLDEIPSENGRARIPGIVARQLMLNCL